MGFYGSNIRIFLQGKRFPDAPAAKKDKRLVHKKTSAPDVNPHHSMTTAGRQTHSATFEENKIAFFLRIHDKTGGPCVERRYRHPHHATMSRVNFYGRCQRNTYGKTLCQRRFDPDGYRPVPLQTKYRRYLPTGNLFHPHAAKRQRYSPRIPNRDLQQRICRNQCDGLRNYSFFTHRYGRSAYP